MFTVVLKVLAGLATIVAVWVLNRFLARWLNEIRSRMRVDEQKKIIEDTKDKGIDADKTQKRFDEIEEEFLKNANNNAKHGASDPGDRGH